MGLYAEYNFIDDGGFPDEVSGGNDKIGEASVRVDYSEACAVFVDTFLQVANLLVPVDTGYLRSTIDAGEWGDGFWCEATADYAQYVEYGTSYMDAQPYFEPALAAAFGEAMDVAQQAVSQAQEELQAILTDMMSAAMSVASGGGGMMSATWGQFFGGLALFAVMAIILFPVLALAYGVMDSLSLKGDYGGGGGYPEVIIT